MKSLFKKKDAKVKIAPPAAPRSLDDIKREAGELMGQIGSNQYQLSVLKDENDKLCARLRQVNYEGSERIKLDKESEAKNVQS